MDQHHTTHHYRKPGWATRNLFNRAVAGLTRMGVGVWGSRVLEVRGRRTGEPRQTPVNLLRYEGSSYLVSPRGETEWVRNVRAGGGRLDLRLGRRRTRYLATELSDDEKIPVLRAYLRRWKVEVGVFFDGVGPESSDEEIAAIAPRHPVFSLSEL
ncbi:MAG TPA: nitroreductase family deazaflavin-dependent oxidoreductase [Acidimicrobiales bacterium]|nr:nitroreductase family deazaflavin-dependent oxidoreductase [Acidimicrobiales bacterium]